MENNLIQGVPKEIYVLWTNAKQQRTRHLKKLGLSVGAANALGRATKVEGTQWNDLAVLRETPLEVIQISVGRIGLKRAQEIASLIALTGEKQLGVQLPLGRPF